MSIKDLHSISMSAIKQFFSFISATRRSLQTDFYKLFIQIEPKFNVFVLGQWPMANFPTNLQENRSNISWDILATGRQTDRQTDKQRGVAEVIITIRIKNNNYMMRVVKLIILIMITINDDEPGRIESRSIMTKYRIHFRSGAMINVDACAQSRWSTDA